MAACRKSPCEPIAGAWSDEHAHPSVGDDGQHRHRRPRHRLLVRGGCAAGIPWAAGTPATTTCSPISASSPQNHSVATTTLRPSSCHARLRRLIPRRLADKDLLEVVYQRCTGRTGCPGAGRPLSTPNAPETHHGQPSPAPTNLVSTADDVTLTATMPGNTTKSCVSMGTVPDPSASAFLA